MLFSRAVQTTTDRTRNFGSGLGADMKRRSIRILGSCAAGLSLISLLIVETGSAALPPQTQAVPPAQIREAALAYLARYLPWPGENVEVRDITFPREILVPAGKIVLEFSPPAAGKTSGSISFPAQVHIDQKLARRFWVTATVEAYRMAVAATRPIVRGQTLGPEDVYLRRLPVRDLPAGALSEISRVLERKTRRSLQVHQVLSQTFLETPAAVRKGEVVKIVVESPSLRIETTGKTAQDGGVGEVIRVLNLGSRKEVYGRVLDDKTVRVEY